MGFVIGRGRTEERGQHTGHLGTYQALDGSDGAPLYLDLDRPHAMVVVGKRGYGKSYTLGVIAEELARTPGVTPVVIDPMGVFGTLADPARGSPVPAVVLDSPRIRPDSLGPRAWCRLLGLSPESGPGAVLWRAVLQSSSVDGILRTIEGATAAESDRRATANHVELADSWSVFASDGLGAEDILDGQATVIDLSGWDRAPMNAVTRGLLDELYGSSLEGRPDTIPWILVDEAHAFFGGIAAASLKRLLTRGRSPGVSVVVATQRPCAVPTVGISQSDILLSHRLTSKEDIDALTAARPTYLNTSIEDRIPSRPGEVLVIDDRTETAHTGHVRTRDTPHGGGSPRASDRTVG